MTGPFENIVQHLFHQPSLQSVTLEEVLRMAKQHPSFAAAQYLLLKKMQETSHPDFTDQLHKTTLYFNNPLWLQFLLRPNYEVAEQASGGENHTRHAKKETGSQKAAFSTTPDTFMDTVVMDRKEPTEIPSPSFTQTREEEEPQTVTSNSENETFEARTEISDMQPDVKPSESPSMEPVPESQVIESSHSSHGQILIDNEQKMIIETPSAKGDMLFEPYHTIDYFASQGIKLDKMELDPKDKLGKQLKSFTEWLRGMKKLPQVTIEKVLAENDESEVVAAASHSVEDKEVITESMALVLEKQGLNEKAAEIYRKLSLLNPAKSSYFAAKIEALKQ